MHKGFLSIGVEDNSVLLFSELMDSASLFLTANCPQLPAHPAARHPREPFLVGDAL
jgi:hypothetical protein